MTATTSSPEDRERHEREIDACLHELAPLLAQLNEKHSTDIVLSALAMQLAYGLKGVSANGGTGHARELLALTRDASGLTPWWQRMLR